MSQSNRMSRRHFMKQAGITAAAAPFFNILRMPRAHAASVAPLRLLTVWYPWHVPEMYYHPKNSSGGFATAGNSFNISFTNSVLAPLAKYQNKMLVFRGLGYAQGPYAHSSNSIFATGCTSRDISQAVPGPSTNGSSIDQYLFSRMAQSGSLDPMLAGLLSYVPGAEYSTNGYGCPISWRSGTAQLFQANPKKLFQIYFGNYSTSKRLANKALIGVNPTVAARRSKALSIAQNGLNDFLAQLPETSQTTSVLQSHGTAISGILSQLSGSLPGGTPTPTPTATPVPTATPTPTATPKPTVTPKPTATPSVTPTPTATPKPTATPTPAPTPTPSGDCQVPSASSIANDTLPDSGPALNFDNWQNDFNSFATLLTEAFACDLTRFATFKLSATDNPLLHLTEANPMMSGYAEGNFHDNVSHTAHDDGSKSDIWVAKQASFWHSLVAQLMDKLATTIDPYSPGQSLLDNTVILVGSEGPIQTPGLADPHNQGQADQPFLVLGGCGGLFNMGRLIDARSLGKISVNGNNLGAINHNALLTNIVNAFETNQKQFNSSFTTKILNQYGDYSFPVSPTNWLST